MRARSPSTQASRVTSAAKAASEVPGIDVYSAPVSATVPDARLQTIVLKLNVPSRPLQTTTDAARA